MLKIFPDHAETIEGAGAALRAGETTCAEVLDRCLARVGEWEPKVKAWVVIDRDGARDQARVLDDELAAGKCRGPLHGIPFGVKDIIDVKGLPTACGFAPWRDRVAEADAWVVEQLRSAGAVILGKTVTTQFAWIDPPVTRNPWDQGRTPGGSSSGSAAAVATGMCLGAIGTQTGGSIIRPASFCGVTGYKPSHGHYRTEGILPFAPSFDVPGPITRTVSDSRLVDAAILRNLLHTHPFDRGRAETIETAGEEVEAMTRPRTDPPKLTRPPEFFQRRADPEMLGAVDDALSILREAGAEILDDDPDEIDYESLLTDHRLMMAAEAAAGHESRFSRHSDAYAGHIRALVEEGLSLRATRYVACSQRWAVSAKPAKTLVTPAAVGPAPDPSTTGNPCMNSPFSFLGVAAVSLPFALSREGLPLAIQLVAGSHDFWDRDLLSAAAWSESVLRRASGQGSD